MKYRTLLIGFLTIIGLSGCGTDSSTVKANFQYSEVAGLGTHNAANYEPGSLFIWNIETNELDFLETLTLTPQKTVVISDDQISKSIAGLKVERVPESLLGNEEIINASIAAQSEFIVTGAVREDYAGTITKISEYVRTLKGDQQNPDLLLHPRDDKYRLVIIRSVLRAQASSLSIGGADASEPGKVIDVDLNSPIGEIASVKVQVGSSTSCGSAGDDTAETSPVCFFKTLVLDPHYEAGTPTMQFKLGSKSPTENLPGAFRNLH